jgi:hypothetical protein
MSLQYISDSNGQTTGIFIPIDEWNEMKKKYHGIEKEEIMIPSWQIDAVRERVVDYNKNPSQALDLNNALDDIENNM